MFAPDHPIVHPAQRPTVLLLHSSASSARQWEGLVESLQPRFRVRTIEFHGHGARPGWQRDGPFALADDAALAAPLLAESGGAHLVGHSYGAAVALKLATLHPAHVRSVAAYEPVLFRWLIDDDTSPGAAQGIVALADAIRDRVADGDEASAARRFIDFWCGSGAWDSLPIGRREAIATRMHAVLLHFDALFGESPGHAALARLRMPMLFMTGARTVTATRRIAELLRHALPRARHEVLQGMGHMGPITHAAEVNCRIVQFLGAHALSGPVLEPSGEPA